MELLKPTISNLAAPSEIKPIKVVSNELLTDIIPFGANNLFPQELAELYRNSKIHRATLNDKTDYFVGTEYLSEGYQELIDVVNLDGSSMKDEQSKIQKDFNLIGNGWIELVTDTARSFLFIYHIDATTARLAKDKESVFISPDWRTYRSIDAPEIKQIPLYPNFQRDGMVLRSIYHTKDYEPEFKNYGIPQYIAGRDEMAIDYKTSKYNLSKVINYFGGNKIIFFPVESDPQAKDFIENLEKNHIGEGKNGKNMYQPYKSGTNIDNAVDKVQTVDVGGDDKGGWTEISEKAKNDIIMSHSWYRSLMSTGDNTGFNTNMVYQEYQAALRGIEKNQDKFKGIYNKLYAEILGIELDLQITNKPPVDVEVKADDLKFIWEMREEKGLDFDKTDENQQMTIGEWKSKFRSYDSQTR